MFDELKKLNASLDNLAVAIQDCGKSTDRMLADTRRAQVAVVAAVIVTGTALLATLVLAAAL